MLTKPSKMWNSPIGTVFRALENKFGYYEKLFYIYTVKLIKRNTMDKFMLLNYVKERINTDVIINDIKKFDTYKNWNVTKIETVGDRGVLMYVKTGTFNGSILITYDNREFYVRKVNKCGMVLLVNHTKYFSILKTIIDLYLAD